MPRMVPTEATRVKQDAEARLYEQALQNLGLTAEQINPKGANGQRLRTELKRLESIQTQQALGNLGLPLDTRLNKTNPQAVLGVRQETQNIQMNDAIDREIAELESELSQLSPQPQAQQFSQQQFQPFGQTGSPLLSTLKDDVTRRVFANQASQGRLGGGEVSQALAGTLAPFEIQQQQQQIDNLFRLFGMGSNISAGMGSMGLGAAGNMGQTIQSGAQAQAQGALNRGNAFSNTMGNLAGFAGAGMFGSPSIGSPVAGFGLGGGLPFSPTAGSNPFTA